MLLVKWDIKSWENGGQKWPISALYLQFCLMDCVRGYQSAQAFPQISYLALHNLEPVKIHIHDMRLVPEVNQETLNEPSAF
jgi:hypothetical protein